MSHPGATRPRHLCHPLPLLAVLLLAVNDHVLKGAGLLPGSVTGKLSDVAGLFFFPLLLVDVTGWLAPHLPRRRVESAAAVWTGAVFAALKVWPAFNGAIGSALGPNALDPGDLLCLPAIGAAVIFMRVAEPAQVGELFRLGLVGAAALASMATSWIPRPFPGWAPEKPAHWRIDCADVELRVAKSGKEGAGVVLDMRTGEPPCELHLEQAQMILTSGPVSAPGLPASFTLAPGTPAYAWLPFRFDGDAAWNRGERRARLRLRLRAKGPPQDLETELFNEMRSSPLPGDERQRTEGDP